MVFKLKISLNRIFLNSYSSFWNLGELFQLFITEISKQELTGIEKMISEVWFQATNITNSKQSEKTIQYNTIQYINTIITWSSAPLSRHHYGSAHNKVIITILYKPEGKITEGIGKGNLGQVSADRPRLSFSAT